MIDISKEYNKIIETARKRKKELGYTLNDLAEIIDKDPSAIASHINYKRCPRLDNILVVLKALGIEVVLKANGKEL